MLYNFFWNYNDKIFTYQDYEYFLSIINTQSKYKDIESPFIDNVPISEFNSLSDDVKSSVTNSISTFNSNITADISSEYVKTNSIKSKASAFSTKLIMPSYVKLLLSHDSSGNKIYHLENDTSIQFITTDILYANVKIYGYFINKYGAVLTFGETIPLIGGTL